MFLHHRRHLVGRLLSLAAAALVQHRARAETEGCGELCHPPIPLTPAGQGRVRFASEWHECYPDRPQVYDVAIIGGGVVGCSIAYRLSMMKLKVILVDEHLDVGEGTSKANSAILHTGFDSEPGSLESRLLNESSREWPELVRTLKIPYRCVGAVLVATNTEERSKLQDVLEKAKHNNVNDCVLLSSKEVLKMEPNVTDACTGGVWIPREAITDPFAVCVAYAETAVLNGVDVLLGASVSGIKPMRSGDSVITDVCFRPSEHDCPVRTPKELMVRAKRVINAAGLGSKAVVELHDQQLSKSLDLNPRRGQFLVLKNSNVVSSIVLPMPNDKTKGILVCPTIFGNTLAGPTAEDLPASALKDLPTVTNDGLEEVRKGSTLLVPAVEHEQVVTTYAGHRCHRQGGSYFIHTNAGTNITTIAGIRSTGLSTSPALSRMIAEELFPHVPLKAQALSGRRDYPPWYRHSSDKKDLVCSFEKVTEADVKAALNSSLRPHTLDSIKRRTRAMMGICQGDDCRDKVVELICGHTGLNSITKCGCNSMSIDAEDF